jgi:hypothetical protein
VRPHRTDSGFRAAEGYGYDARVSLFRRGTRSEADAAVTHVEMLKRINYGSAKVRVTYEVEPPDEASFEAVLEANVKMETLPQSGHRVRVATTRTTTRGSRS